MLSSVAVIWGFLDESQSFKQWFAVQSPYLPILRSEDAARAAPPLTAMERETEMLTSTYRKHTACLRTVNFYLPEQLPSGLHALLPTFGSISEAKS